MNDVAGNSSAARTLRMTLRMPVGTLNWLVSRIGIDLSTGRIVTIHAQIFANCIKYGHPVSPK